MTTLENVTYYQKNKDKLLQNSKYYYEKNKEQRKQYRRNKYSNMSDEERLNVLKYRREWYHKLDLEEKRGNRNYSKTVSDPVKVNESINSNLSNTSDTYLF